jgi:hypothetical protein
MDYNPDQQAILERMGKATRAMRDAAVEHAATLATTGDRMLDAVRELAAAQRQSRETLQLFTEYTIAFAEFIDSLK